MTLRLRGILLLVLCLGMLVPVQVFSAQDSPPIRVLSTKTENNAPDNLTFNLSAEADHPIQEIFLYYKVRGDISTRRQPLEFTSGVRVDVTFIWDTSQNGLAPSSPILFYWVVEDDQGNKITTPEETVYFDDLRFPWKEITDVDLIVRWYEGGDVFGQYVYQTARQSLERMKEQTGEELDFPIIVLVYANPDDFRSWYFYIDDWVAGRAFSSLGITTQIIPSSSSQAWIGDVIPHEIAHLYFFQLMDAPMASWPAWMDEGLAQTYELNNPQPALDRVGAEARAGTLLPLSSLSGSFGRDPDQVQLSYAQSLSVVTYILETWGDEGLQALIAVFRTGEDQRDGVETALGLSWEQFEADWITWMGVPATPRPSPSPTATFAFATPPGSWPLPTKSDTATPQRPEPIPPEFTETPPSSEETNEQGFFDLVCGGSAMGVLLLPVLGWVVRRKVDR